MNFTPLRLYAQSSRICSKPRMVTNGAIPRTNGILPACARPAATPMRFSSLMPTSRWRSGKRSVNPRTGPKSCETSTMRGSAAASSLTTFMPERAAT